MTLRNFANPLRSLRDSSGSFAELHKGHAEGREEITIVRQCRMPNREIISAFFLPFLFIIIIFTSAK